MAFSTAVYKAETWQARLVKVAPELPFVRMLTGWSRRSDAASTEALAFYLFKMALGQPEAAALEPPDSLSNNRIRAALRKAQDQVETRAALSGRLRHRCFAWPAKGLRSRTRWAAEPSRRPA